MKKITEILGSHVLIAQVSGVVCLAALTTLLMNMSWGILPSDVEIGRIAQQDIRADKDYEILDTEATAKLQSEASRATLPVFDWDESLGREKIVEEVKELGPWRESGVVVRRIRQEGQPKVILRDLSSIISLEQARKQLFKKGKRDVRPTLFLNREETEAAQAKAVAGVPPILLKVEAGESIIRVGDRFEFWHVTVINGIRELKNKSFLRTKLLGTFLFVLLFFLVLFFVFRENVPNESYSSKDLIFLGASLLSLVSMERIFLFLCNAVRGLLPLEVSLASFYGLMPIAAGTMIVRLVLPLPFAILFSIASTTLVGMLLPGAWQGALFYLAGCVFSLQLMKNVRSRSRILEAGLKLAIFNVAALTTLDLLGLSETNAMMALNERFVRLGLAFGGGILSSLVVLVLTPIFEMVFNYLTPIKLLEFGSLNHPLLRQMIVSAPGTYHHSHMVGTLAETACEAIGADSLFARVASYFHDIGKMKKSPYFIENQSPTDDRHSSLSPSMSALIICSHVKDGVELAKEHKLPQKIVDIIPQHQGTKLISYFYSKAKENENPELHVVDEREYRYPGPKPQTREAGVILLADTVEAATRALKDRSPARLEEVVRNMINKNFIDGQLDECELTLKDLHVIANSFVRILMGIYHQRIEYPADAAEKAARENPSPDNGDKYSQSKPLSEDSLREAPKSADKTLPRIGGERSRH